MIYITGESDSGKTTCAGFLRGHLEDSGTSADYLDCDPGQSSVGPPATIGLRGGSRELLRFAGSRTGTGVHGPGGPGSTRRLA
ncbi:MAG: Clp1/GlmU family protein [Spirochaetota bacterium]